MFYADFVDSIRHRTHLSKRVIRLLLDAIPDTLLELQQGDSVRTPFGTFRIVHTKEHRIVYPEGRGEGVIPEQLVVKMAAHKGLKVTPDNPLWDYLIEPCPKKVAKKEKALLKTRK